LTELAAAETLVRELADELTGVHPGECLYCYVARMLDDFGCDNQLRWAMRFRDLTAPRATALESRLCDVGGYCDCEIFLNVVVWASPAGGCAEYVRDKELTMCAGVRRGSTQGCVRWTRNSHWLPF
jgi:uncharacterized protein DUF2695